MMKKRNILLTLSGIIAMILILTIIWVNQNDFIKTANRDNQRKTDINAIYFYLTEKYYQENQYYPEFINEDTFGKTNLGFDHNKKLINSIDSEYSYKTSNCQKNQCQKFEIKAKMELEADYIKSN